MTKQLITLFILFLGFSVKVKAKTSFSKDTTENLTFIHHQVKSGDKILATYTISKTDSSSFKDKINVYLVKIYSSEGTMVAEYDIEVLDKLKKNQLPVVSASLKTKKDNVTHHASNFIDYHQVSTQKDAISKGDYAPQLGRAIKYLMDYNYL